MNSRYSQIADVVFELQAELRRLQLWDDEPPEPAALLSQQPFAIDTLEFYQWVQFIFVPRITLILENQAPLPTTSDISPMAEEYFQGLVHSGDRVIELFRLFDELIQG